MRMKNHLFLFLILALFVSCKKDKSDNTSISEGKYNLKSVISDRPVDLNYDDIANVDLSKELVSLSDISLYVKLDHKESVNHYINIIWVEPKINDQMLYTPLPATYDPGLKIEYLPVDNAFYFNFSESSKQINLGSKLVTDAGDHTLTLPEKLEYDNEKQTIKFKGQQKYLTKSGISSYFFTALYERDKDYISP